MGVESLVLMRMSMRRVSVRGCLIGLSRIHLGVVCITMTGSGIRMYGVRG